MMKESVHLKGLNGLRAIAALGVVIAHTAVIKLEFGDLIPTGLTSYAVTIFFTLSGFLITYLLFLEKEKKEINVKKFYLRRILRIWPLYFAYLIVAIAITYFQHPEKSLGSLPYYIFFAANIPSYLLSSLPYLGHYWSIGVEEQFYLFWPWIIKRSKYILRTIIIFTVAFFILKLIARFVFYEQGNPLPLRILYSSRFECMSIGGIGALLCLRKHSLFLKLTANKFTEIVCWLCIAAIAVNRFYITDLVNHDVVAIVTVCLIVNLSFNNNAIISLENRVFDFLGRISYGIYVIHPLMIYGFHELLKPLSWQPLWKDLLFFISVISSTILTAWLSYEFFEKRFLRMKDRFSVVKTVA